jgi:hypothetical protein
VKKKIICKKETEEFFPVLRGIFGMFYCLPKMFVFSPSLLVEYLMMFSGTLVGKHCTKIHSFIDNSRIHYWYRTNG